MNVYVIYKFSNYNEVKEKLNAIKDSVKDISFYYFNPCFKQKFWRNIAKKKIKECDMVLFFDFIDDDPKFSFKNIKWELKQAEKLKKRIVAVKNQDESYSSNIYEKDYSEKETNHKRYQVNNLQETISFLKQETEWCIKSNLINSLPSASPSNKTIDISFEDKTLLLEQYRMMIETSEKLMERRQAMVNLYITICSALIAFIGASFGFGSLLISSSIALLSGIVIIVLCYNWHSSLNAYEMNNEGKFEVINQIEKHLPAEMFECEYRYNKQKGIRSYSAREKLLPLIFMFFGITLIFFSGILFFLNWKSL